MTHHVPADHSAPSRVRTGYEMIVPLKASSMFIIKARMKGEIIEIHEKESILKVKYADGKISTYQYGKIRGEVSGSYLEHELILSEFVKVGFKVEKGNILAYHKGFFSYDKYHDTVSWNHGTNAKVALMEKDVTLEDSCLISNEFSKKLDFKSIYPRTVRISSDMIIKEYAKIGQEVDYDTVLCKFEFEDTASVFVEDSSVDELIDELKYAEYKSKNKGVVSDIQVFYTSDELTESVKKFIAEVTRTTKRRAVIAKNSSNEDKFNSINKIPPETRIRGMVLGEMDILIIFYITTTVDCGVGDKIVFDSSLKSVVGDVESGDILTENGSKVDAIFGAKSIFNRIILSPLITGILSLVLEKGEKNAVDMYFKE